MAYNLDRFEPGERTDLYVDPSAEEEAPRSGRLLRICGALLVMGLFAGGLWAAYTQGMHHAGGSLEGGADVPLIRADTRPFKIKPDNPGGMQIPDRDMLIYGQQRPQIEHLLPPPEEPMARPEPPPPARSAPATASAPPAPNPPPQTALAMPPQAGSRAPASPSPAATVSQSLLPGGPQAAAAETEPPAPVAAPPARPEVPRPAWAAASAPASDLIGERIEQLGLADAHPQKSGSERNSAGKMSGLRLQFGAVRSASEARSAWQRLKRTNPDLLGNLSAAAVRADLGDRGVYYRIETGPIADPATAERICGELRGRHLPCMTLR